MSDLGRALRHTPPRPPRDVTKGPVLPACRPPIDVSMMRAGPLAGSAHHPAGKDLTPRRKELDPSPERTWPLSGKDLTPSAEGNETPSLPTS
jgi:hypothetical protein